MLHIEKLLCVHSSRILRHVHAGKRHERSRVRIRCRRAHRIVLGADYGSRRHARVAIRSALLQFLYHCLVLIGSLDGAYAERSYGNAARLYPFIGQDFVERIGKLLCVTRERAVADTHLGYAGKSGLKSRHKLGFKLAVNPVAGIGLFYVAAYVRIEEQGIYKPVGVFAVAAYRDIDIKADILVNDAERYGRGRAILVGDDFLCVEVVYALIPSGVAAHREALAYGLKRILYVLAELTVENGRLG